MSILVGALSNQGHTGGRSGLAYVTAFFLAMVSTSTMSESAAIRSGTALPSVRGISTLQVHLTGLVGLDDAVGSAAVGRDRPPRRASLEPVSAAS
jgi:hypothetical protein